MNLVKSALLSLLVLPVACPSGFAQNVILNPGFEVGDASGGDLPGAADWSTFEFTFTTSQTPPQNGAQCMKMYGPWFENGASGAFQNHPASAGETWNASVAVLDSSADPLTNIGIFQMNFLDAGGNPVGNAETIVDASLPDDVWTPLDLSAVAPAGTVEVQIFLLHIQIGDITGGSVFWDDVRLEKVDAICADSGILVEGVGEVNDFNATCGSDDVRWEAHGATFAFQITDPVTQFELSATVATAAPTTISIDVEANKTNNNANLNLRALIFNHVTGTYVAMPGIMALATTDAIQTFDLPVGANPAEFVDPNSLEVRVLLQTIQTSGFANVRTQIDEVVFNAN